MTQFVRMIEEAVDRMADSDGSRWHREVEPRAAVIARGAFYAGGPVCLVAYDAAGAYLGTVVEDDALRMAGHPNSRPIPCRAS